MIQLVGLWSFRNRVDDTITVEAAKAGIVKAQQKLGQLVHEPALTELSDADRRFLVCMAQDDKVSTMADITQRLDVSKQYASNYRRRLMDAELIESPEIGKVDFALPYLREYLRKHKTELVGG